MCAFKILFINMSSCVNNCQLNDYDLVCVYNFNQSKIRGRFVYLKKIVHPTTTFSDIFTKGNLIWVLKLDSNLFHDNWKSGGRIQKENVVFVFIFYTRHNCYRDSEPQCVVGMQMGHFAMLSCTTHARITYIFVWVQQRPLLIFCYSR